MTKTPKTENEGFCMMKTFYDHFYPVCATVNRFYKTQDKRSNLHPTESNFEMNMSNWTFLLLKKRSVFLRELYRCIHWFMRAAFSLEESYFVWWADSIMTLTVDTDRLKLSYFVENTQLMMHRCLNETWHLLTFIWWLINVQNTQQWQESHFLWYSESVCLVFFLRL